MPLEKRSEVTQPGRGSDPHLWHQCSLFTSPLALETDHVFALDPSRPSTWKGFGGLYGLDLNLKWGWDLENQEGGRWARPEGGFSDPQGWLGHLPLVLGENYTQCTGKELRGSKPQDNVGAQDACGAAARH